MFRGSKKGVPSLVLLTCVPVCCVKKGREETPLQSEGTSPGKTKVSLENSPLKPELISLVGWQNY